MGDAQSAELADDPNPIDNMYVLLISSYYLKVSVLKYFNTLPQYPCNAET